MGVWQDFLDYCDEWTANLILNGPKHTHELL
jgi:hypothetical protein